MNYQKEDKQNGQTINRDLEIRNSSKRTNQQQAQESEAKKSPASSSPGSPYKVLPSPNQGQHYLLKIDGYDVKL